jgi:hypothetical protein
MSLEGTNVNLWKTQEVSLLQTLSYSTRSSTQHSVDSSAEDSTNMVLDSLRLRGYL